MHVQLSNDELRRSSDAHRVATVQIAVHFVRFSEHCKALFCGRDRAFRVIFWFVMGPNRALEFKLDKKINFRMPKNPTMKWFRNIEKWFNWTHNFHSTRAGAPQARSPFRRLSGPVHAGNYSDRTERNWTNSRNYHEILHVTRKPGSSSVALTKLWVTANTSGGTTLVFENGRSWNWLFKTCNTVLGATPPHLRGLRLHENEKCTCSRRDKCRVHHRHFVEKLGDMSILSWLLRWQGAATFRTFFRMWRVVFSCFSLATQARAYMRFIHTVYLWIYTF